MKIVSYIFLLSLCTLPAYAAEEQGFAEWLQSFKAEALSEGIREAVLQESLADITYNNLVIKLDRNQPEFKLSLASYLGRTVSDTRVKKGKVLLRNNSDILNKVAERYGVQPRFLIALWGIETDFGRVTGSFPIIESLATLSYDPRRSAFFKRELLAALHVVNDGYIPLEKMKGSWAGAMGYLQFLPSVFRKHKVDYDSNGVVSIWDNHGDLFATAANYLAASGWQAGKTWGREVAVPKGFDVKLLGLSRQLPLAEWQRLGIRRSNGKDLPKVAINASLIRPDKETDRFFLVYNNFRVLMKWNRSTYYAVAVGLLSDHIVE